MFLWEMSQSVRMLEKKPGPGVYFVWSGLNGSGKKGKR